MFTYIKLHNFKCFDDIRIDLTDKRNNPKKLIILYGGNASGKTNFLSVFSFLQNTFTSMMIRDLFSSFLIKDNTSQEEVERLIKESQFRIEDLIKEYKMIGSDNETMSVEVGFQIEDQTGSYLIETNNSSIIKEKLEFVIEKNRGTYIDLDSEKKQINKKQFLTTDSFNEIKNSCNKYWGQHTFLSILHFECKDKVESFFKDNISESLKKVLNFFQKISVRDFSISSEKRRRQFEIQHKYIFRIDRGIILEQHFEKLIIIEKCLNEILPKLFKNIKHVYYRKYNDDHSIRYTLFIQNLISGKIRDIEITKESSGLKKFLRLLPYLIYFSKGQTLVIDEFDNGLHDIFIKTLIESVYNTFNSQAIVTTHNTYIMEANIPKECFYTISDSNDGIREIKHITFYDPKIGQHTNIRKQYLSDKYGGLPIVSSINFKRLYECFR